MENGLVTVETTVNIPLDKAWDCFTNPAHVTHWNFASPDWYCPKAENDLRAGGRFTYSMAAKDGSFSFDFSGVHEEVEIHKRIKTLLDDGRIMEVSFQSNGDNTLVTETFEPENIHPVEFQKAGWQAILDNYKLHAESHT
jgi:uncharacterized protein YndB with AHSA1/START domain